MAKKRLVSFISDEKLLKAVKQVVDKTKEAISKADTNIDKNRLDPFSAIFDSIFHGLDYQGWLKKERSRQVQKTMQNAIGDFHQMIIGGIDGWEDLGKGNVADVRNDEKKIIAEIKNKFNTVTGQHLVRIYDELENALAQDEHRDFQAYLVTIIAKDKDELRRFTPSDNKTHINRAASDFIMLISGHRFYDIATGQEDSLYTLFKALPSVLEEHFGCDVSAFKSERIIKEIYDRTYVCGKPADVDEDRENDE